MNSFKPRVLLVDLDGTLLGSHNLKLRYQFTTRMIRALKRGEFAPGTLRSVKALRSTTQAILDTSKDANKVTNWDRASRAFALSLGQDEAESIERMQAAVKEVFPTLASCFFPIPGAKDFIAWARERFDLILATNPVWSEDIVHMRLGWAGVDPTWFKSITHAQRMHACKPSTAYYSELLTQESLKPAECLMIGDDLDKDLPAAFIGVPTFILGKAGVANRATPKDRRLVAPVWRGSFTALQALLQKSLAEGGLQ